MRRVVGALMMTALLAMNGAAVAHDGEHAAGKAMTAVGEIVDTGCYLSHGASGAKHAQCAQLCISKGMPMGLLTATGDLYLLTPPHDTMTAYKKAKDWAGKKVEISGPMSERNGMKSIEVASAKLAPA
ncbi:MAG TPA: hypothetical protein VFR25_00830 [Candidatus Eisenbacteria bacterium]|nr:hypothetical protein [Candidatus Eisenbacteria bacterium]